MCTYKLQQLRIRIFSLYVGTFICIIISCRYYIIHNGVINIMYFEFSAGERFSFTSARNNITQHYSIIIALCILCVVFNKNDTTRTRTARSVHSSSHRSSPSRRLLLLRTHVLVAEGQDESKRTVFVESLDVCNNKMTYNTSVE